MNQPSPRQRWGKSFANPSGAAFAAIVSPGVTLEGSIFAPPVHGREAVWTTLRTDSAHSHPAFLILVTQDQFTGLAIHHRPLAAVLAFSVEMPNLWPAVTRAAGTLAGPSVHLGKDGTT